MIFVPILPGDHEGTRGSNRRFRNIPGDSALPNLRKTRFQAIELTRYETTMDDEDVLALAFFTNKNPI